MRYSMWPNAVCTCSKAQCTCLVVTCTTCTTSHLLMSIYFGRLHACVHRWWSVESMFLLFDVGRAQCLWCLCCWWPSCCCWVPCPQNGGPPLWLWWWWIHSLALGSPRGPVLHGGVPREILRIWSESKGQGWPIWYICVYSTLYAFVYSKCFERVSSSVSFHNCYGMVFLYGFFVLPILSIRIVTFNYSLTCSVMYSVWNALKPFLLRI